MNGTIKGPEFRELPMNPKASTVNPASPLNPKLRTSLAIHLHQLQLAVPTACLPACGVEGLMGLGLGFRLLFG